MSTWTPADARVWTAEDLHAAFGSARARQIESALLLDGRTVSGRGFALYYLERDVFDVASRTRDKD